MAARIVYRNGAKVGEVASDRTSYADDQVKPTTTYTYVVVAEDVAGNVIPCVPGAVVIKNWPAARSRRPLINRSSLNSAWI